MTVTVDTHDPNGASLILLLPHEGKAFAAMHGYKMGVQVELHWLSPVDLMQLREGCDKALDNYPGRSNG